MNVKSENQGDFLFFRCFEKTKNGAFFSFLFSILYQKTNEHGPFWDLVFYFLIIYKNCIEF